MASAKSIIKNIIGKEKIAKNARCMGIYTPHKIGRKAPKRCFECDKPMSKKGVRSSTKRFNELPDFMGGWSNIGGAPKIF